MLINTFTSQNCNSGLNYTSRLPKGVFYDAKDIPRLRCAKCNHHMISKAEQSAILYETESVSNEDIMKKIPSKQKKAMPEAVKYVWNVLKEKGIKGVTKLFFGYKIGETIAEKTEAENKQIHEVLESAYNTYIGISRKPLPTKKVIKNLAKFREELPKENQELVDIITNYTKIYPNDSLAQIMRNKELYRYHDNIANAKMRLFNVPYAEHMEKMDKLAEKLPEEQKNKLLELNDSVSSIVRNKSTSERLKRELISEHYAELVDNISNKNIQRSLVSQINKMPLAEVTGDYLFCKLHRSKPTNTEDVVEFIVQPRKNTFEHVHARSKGGKDDVGNGIYMCRICNNERADHPYPTMMRVFPEFKDNIQKQVSRLGTFIKRGSLIGYDTYPQDIKSTMKEVSGEDISIKSFLKKDNK